MTDISCRHLPETGSDWSAYAQLGARFDAPRASGSTDVARELASWAFSRWQRPGELPGTLDELGACLWFEQRRWRVLRRKQGPVTLHYRAAVARAMRVLV